MNCLRCGREISDDLTFCAECWKTVKEPLEESHYLNTQLVLPVGRKSVKAAPAKKVKKTEKRNEKNHPGVNRALTTFLGGLCILVLAFALLVSLSYLNLRSERAELLASADALEQENSFFAERMELLSQNVVLVKSAEDRYYHRVDCPVVVPEGCEIIRLRTALKRGYLPCPECH